MSRYIVTSGSHFDPFTYDELAKPLVQATEAHNAAADAYGKISMETEALRQYITNNPGDRGAKATYDTYVNQLQALQKDLWDKGLTAATRQQLAEARDQYAGQVMPIATAIQNRQQRSADYWKMRREHPDMIMGEDPGIAGLDDYVSNPNYGQDYYTYSGNQFQKEVAADAKARADELLRDIEGRLDVDKDSELAGYLRAIKQNGFTSGEVARAYDAVAGGVDLNSLNVPEKILAEVLVSHLNSTGARGKVSLDEYSRLMEYGRQGLSEAIGKTDVQYLQDQQWQLNKQKELARYQASLKTPKGGDDDKPTRKNGYILNHMLYNFQTPGYADMAKAREAVDKKYTDAGGSVTLNLPGGGSKPISSSSEMMDEVFNPQIRKTFREQTGLDIALPAVNGWTSKRKKELYVGHNLDGEEVAVTRKLNAIEAAELGLSTQDAAVTKTDGSLDRDMTVAYNRARDLYEQYVDGYRKANPNINIDDYVYRTPKDEAKFRMDEGLDNNIDSSDLETIENIKNRVVSGTSPVTLASTEPSHEMARSVLGASLAAELIKNGGANNALHMYYDVDENGFSKGKNGKTTLEDILPSKNEAGGKKVYDSDALLYVQALPEDILAGAGSGRPLMRFATSVSEGEKITDAGNFGSYLYNSLKSPQYSLPTWGQVTGALGIKAPDGAKPGSNMTMCDAAYYLMLPFTRPEEVLNMTDEQSMAWSRLMYQLINDDESDEFRGPVIWSDGQPIAVSAKDIVRHGEFQNALYDGVKEFLNDYLSIVRDDLTQRHMRSFGNQSEKASRYITVEE
jgi:hypothetical protein